MNVLYRWLFHYYIALTMSASAATPMASALSLDAPPPIVRRSPEASVGSWDQREELSVRGEVAVLTAPLEQIYLNDPSIINHN